MQQELAFHEPGIYLGMPFSEYLADPALSVSGIKNLRVSPLTYWIESPLNPDREPDDTEAKETGRAFHKRILEGAEAFLAEYAARPSPADHPDALKSGEQLREKCAELGLSKGGTLAEMGRRIRELDKDITLWSELEEAYQAAHAGKAFLPARTMRRIELAAATIEAEPKTARLFRGGFPEVTIFWIDQATGVRMKARLDYLTLDTIADLKTFSNSQGKPLALAVTGAIAAYGYGIQAVAYLQAVEAAKRLFVECGPSCLHIGESMLDAAFDFDRWFGHLARSKPHRFVFLFQESGRVPNVAVREFGRNMNFYDIALFQFEEAQRRYRDCVSRWGLAVPWAEPAELQALEDEDFPLWAFKE